MPRGPFNQLHAAAHDGSTERTVALLSDGSIDINQQWDEGYTPLMLCCKGGHAGVARILVREGADMSIADDHGRTALHLSASTGHVAMTKLLARAGAELETSDKSGLTPLHYCSIHGHTGVMRALLEAGTNPNVVGVLCGTTPLAYAAVTGHLDSVKVLLQAKADPMLTDFVAPGEGAALVPLDLAAMSGHADVVRELIDQVGIAGCGGESGGVHALSRAASICSAGLTDVMAILIDAGVVDDGEALRKSARRGNEEAVRFLLQQRRQPKKTWEASGGVAYVNANHPGSGTPLLCAIECLVGADDRRPHPRVVRALVDAGADTRSAVQVTQEGEVIFEGTPLGLTNRCLGMANDKEDVDEARLNRLEAIRRLLMGVEAVHAVSWLWPSDDAPPIADGGAGGGRQAEESPTAGRSLSVALPIRRRRGGERGVMWAPTFRCVRRLVLLG